MASLPHCKNQYHNNADDNNNDNDKTTTKTTTINISYCSQIVKASPDSLLQRAPKIHHNQEFCPFLYFEANFQGNCHGGICKCISVTFDLSRVFWYDSAVIFFFFRFLHIIQNLHLDILLMHHVSLVICSKVEGDTFSFAKVVNVCHIETQLDGNVMRNVHL